MKKFSVFLLCMLLIFGLSSFASANLIGNGSFETPEVTNGSHWQIFSAIDSWTIAGGPVVEYQEDGLSTWTAAEGDQWVELDAYAADTTWISQGWASTPGTKYEVSFAFSARPGTNEADNVLAYGAGSGSLFNVSATGLLSTSADGTGLSTTAWTYYSYEFTAFGNFSSIFFGDAGTSNSLGTFIDDVKVTRVPEPATMLLLSFGLLGLAGFGRKKFFKK